MLHLFLEHLAAQLRTGLAGELPDPATRISVGQIAPPGAVARPRLALFSGKMDIVQGLNGSPSSQPQPQEMREVFVVEAGPAAAGPYLLAKTPLDGTARAKVFFSPDLVGERRMLVVEKKDFTINYLTRQLLFSKNIDGAGRLVVQYSFPGVFTMREFQQEFFIDIFETAAAGAEKWASLAAAIALTNYDELLDRFNRLAPTDYAATDYRSTHHLTQVFFLGGGAEMLPDGSPKYQLRFAAKGQFRPVKQIAGGFGIIEHIHSPGRPAVEPVDIDVYLE